FHSDRLGSITALTEECGEIVEQLGYDGWGKRRHPNGADDPAGAITSQTSRGYTGHEMLAEIGLVHMNGRIYDPQIARVVSPDIIVSDATDSQAWNRYSYVGNSPLNATDPSGWECEGEGCPVQL
ncbi:RHS repeat-associated core domain-containing protein, partial [Microbacteriaceae bacterium K1510]|nr:RHS repeat-associated core domain-containing protein [Microbacteriaceae bacterium K1510]